MSVDADTIRRLAFIRYLHTLGTEQARMPEPLSAASLLTLHDAVENFLILATDHFKAKASKTFEGYWDTLRPHLPDGVDLAVEQGMKRLSKARRNVKHYAAGSDRATIELAVADTAAFMAANTMIVFGIDYDTVSMTYVIPQERVRELVAKAETASNSGDQATAMVALVDALEELFEPHSSGTATRYASPFRFGATVRPASWGNDVRGKAVVRHITKVTEVVQKLQAAMRVTALGLDFARYQRFLSLTPESVDYLDGRKEYRAPHDYAPTKEDFGFCLQFIVTAALRLAEVEAHLTRPSWMPEQRQQWWKPWETIARASASET